MNNKNLKFKSGVTLVELIIAMSLLGIVVLGATTFDLASRQFLTSSERKTQVLNELTFILEHMNKNVHKATGDISNLGLIIPGGSGGQIWIRQDSNLTPQNYNDDKWLRYSYNSNNYNLNFCSDFNKNSNSCNVTEELLSRRVIDIIFNSGSGGGWVNRLKLRYDPTKPIDTRENPEANMNVTSDPNQNLFHTPFSHSWT